ncbi:hypothetical protein Y032_0059g3068 [Ancylostoma ceylanicum]|nr:hypothetical protein Y032_0059g3068 [Ancylostoma ceylanicum]
MGYFPGNRSSVRGFRTRPLLPKHTEAFYRYEGSLTTPGCYEAVTWTVLAEPITINGTQLVCRNVYCTLSHPPCTVTGLTKAVSTESSWNKNANNEVLTVTDQDIVAIKIEQLRQVQFQNGGKYRHNYRSTKPLHGRRILYRPNSFNKKLLCGGLQTTSIFAALLVIILAYFL